MRPRIVSAVLACAVLLGWLPVRAAVVSVFDNNEVLHVQSDGSDDIVITVDGQFVLVNGAGPGGGTIAARSVFGIEITGGPGRNVIDLSGVRLQDFTSIPFAMNAPKRVIVNAGAGDDVIVSSEFNDVIDGGPGDDLIIWLTGARSDEINGGDGIDIFSATGTDEHDDFKVQAAGESFLFWQFAPTSRLATLVVTSIEQMDLDSGGGSDDLKATDVENSTLAESGLVKLTLLGGPGDDRFLLENEVLLPGGIAIFGGDGQDTMDFGGYARSSREGVVVSLGNTSRVGLRASLVGDSVVPPTTSDAFGTGSVMYDVDAHTLDLDVLVSNMSAAEGPALRLIAALPGANGGTIVDLDPADVNVTEPAPDSVRITASAVALPAEWERDLLAGAAALLVTTTALPSGEIRGQASVVSFPSTATGAGLASIENALGSEADDIINGNAGDNVLFGGDGNDQLFGGDGDDTLFGGAGSNSLDGGNGSDTVDFSSSLVGVKVNLGKTGNGSAKGEGKDRLSNIENVVGSPFSDKIVGSFADNVIIGGDGDDKIAVKLGNNRIEGGAGNDKIKTGSGDDIVDAGPGDDKINGGGGVEVLDGGLGDDKIKAKLGVVTIRGGPGNDRINGSRDGGTYEGGDGDDVIKGKNADDVIFGGAGDDDINASGGNDVVDGGEGNDRIRGGSGDDRIDGGPGDDEISGDAGVDELRGGPGLDVIKDDPTDAVVEQDPLP